MNTPVPTPGTVSRILWHFTGGPFWNENKRRQSSSPKVAAKAFAALQGILTSRELRLGSYKELIRVRLAERKVYNKTTRKLETKRNVLQELESSPVCCLADVPIIHLSYLAKRYGKFAIGFHRDAVVRAGFNPVFYALDDARSVLEISKSLRFLEGISGDIFKASGDIARELVAELVKENNLDNAPDTWILDVVSEQAEELDNSAAKAQESFRDFLGLVKTFSTDEFGTIYCEREWRSLKKFEFTYEDVAMVVIPRRVGKNEYFAPFCRRASGSLSLPPTLPIIPWEDLVEH